MGTTTMGVKLDEATRSRIKLAAQKMDRTPHWLIKQAIFNYLVQLEAGETVEEIPLQLNESASDEVAADEMVQPFLDFAEHILPQSVARSAVTAAWRRPETDAVPMLLEQARLPASLAEKPGSSPLPWPRSSGTKKGQPDAPVWCKVCFRSFHYLHRKAWR
ncbi:proline dehydrogenase [Pantoea ananatis]|nr:proline dehydrogenase [Pantoea ananatis]